MTHQVSEYGEYTYVPLDILQARVSILASILCFLKIIEHSPRNIKK